MENQAVLTEIRVVPLDSLGDWVRARFPGRASPQWWQALFESLESAVSPLKKTDHSQRVSDLKLGAVAAILAVERQDIDASLGAYWLLRLAAAALRLRISETELPVMLTPDGSAAWALEQLPLSRDATTEVARDRKEQYLTADESFFAPLGVPYVPAIEGSDYELSALREVERILSALPWVADCLTNSEIRREVEAWLAIAERL